MSLAASTASSTEKESFDVRDVPHDTYPSSFITIARR
jgi:hypothetical protein